MSITIKANKLDCISIDLDCGLTAIFKKQSTWNGFTDYVCVYPPKHYGIKIICRIDVTDALFSQFFNNEHDVEITNASYGFEQLIKKKIVNNDQAT